MGNSAVAPPKFNELVVICAPPPSSRLAIKPVPTVIEPLPLTTTGADVLVLRIKTALTVVATLTASLAEMMTLSWGVAPTKLVRADASG